MPANTEPRLSTYEPPIDSVWFLRKGVFAKNRIVHVEWTGFPFVAVHTASQERLVKIQTGWFHAEYNHRIDRTELIKLRLNDTIDADEYELGAKYV